MRALAILVVTASAALGAAFSQQSDPVQPESRFVAAPQKIQDLALARLVLEHRCLAEALYYEARGEGRTGQKAVAEVVFHRMNHGHYGHSICAVVYEGSRHPGCQFSFTCNGDMAHPREEAAWAQAEQLAAQILTGEITLHNMTGGATNYHAVSVNPYWAPTLKKTARIGRHVFYRGDDARES